MAVTLLEILGYGCALEYGGMKLSQIGSQHVKIWVKLLYDDQNGCQRTGSAKKHCCVYVLFSNGFRPQTKDVITKIGTQ